MDSDYSVSEDYEFSSESSTSSDSSVDLSVLTWENSCHEIIIDENNSQSQYSKLKANQSQIVSNLIKKSKKKLKKDKKLLKSDTDYENDLEIVRRDKMRILEGCCNNRCIDLKKYGKEGDEFVYSLTVFNLCRER